MNRETTMETVTMTHKAEYLLPGSFFPEETCKTLDAHDPEEAARRAPKGAFCFILYDVPVPDFDYDESLFRVSGIPQNKSERYYLGGKTYTVEELRRLGQLEGRDYGTLIANITQDIGLGEDGVHRAIRCKPGNWQPFRLGVDQLV